MTYDACCSVADGDLGGYRYSRGKCAVDAEGDEERSGDEGCTTSGDVGGMGSGGSRASLGLASYNEVSYAMVTRSMSSMIIAKSRNKRCSLEGIAPDIVRME